MVQIGLLHEDVEKVINRDLLQIILCIFLWDDYAGIQTVRHHESK